MSEHTNLDTQNEKSQQPNMEFTLQNHEIQNILDLGQQGDVIIPVEVIERTERSTTFRKRDKAQAVHFRQATAKDMEDEMDEADQPEDRPRK